MRRCLWGDLATACPVPRRCLRFFISSTFTDTQLERDALITVYPPLRELARRAGVSFYQPSEMRWGIRAEATARHETAAICMREIQRCQRDSSGLNYLLLLGEKYG